nr:Peptide G protein-coupled receptor [Hymenolepis microstoma]
MTTSIVPNELITVATTPSTQIQKSNVSCVYENDVSLQLARVICTQILMPIVCIVGVTGNVLNIVVLTTVTMRSSTSCYLCAVAISDLLYSINGLPLTLRTYPTLEKSAAYMNALTYLLAFGNMWSNITAWLTCAFTIERFIAISTPIRSRKSLSSRRTQWNIFFVSLIVVLITLPDFFERKIKLAQRACMESHQSAIDYIENVDPCIETFYVLEPTWIGIQLDGFGWSYANVALFVFFPLIVLAIFNALLIKSVIKAHRKRNEMFATSVRFKGDRRQKTPSPPIHPPSTRKELAWRKWWITRQYNQQNSVRRSPLSTQAPLDITSEENTVNTQTSIGSVAKIEDFTINTFHNEPSETTYCFRFRKCDATNKSESSNIYRSSHQDKQSVTITLIACTLQKILQNLAEKEWMLTTCSEQAQNEFLKAKGLSLYAEHSHKTNTLVM